MGALCTEFVKLSVGVGRRWREESQTWGSSLLSEVSTDIQSLALSHGGTALVLIQLQTQTQGAGSWGQFHYRGRVLLLREGFQIRDRNSGLHGKPRKTSWAYPAIDKPSVWRGRKGRTHRVVAALISNHLNRVHACSQRLGWRKAHRNLCLLKQWLHTELGCTIAVTRENGEPRTDTRCLTKTRIKNRQTTVGQFVSYTIYSRLRGFSFFQSNTEKESQKIHLLLPQRPFHPKKGQWSTSHSHTHMDLVQNLVTFHLGSFLQL